MQGRHVSHKLYTYHTQAWGWTFSFPSLFPQLSLRMTLILYNLHTAQYWSEYSWLSNMYGSHQACFPPTLPHFSHFFSPSSLWQTIFTTTKRISKLQIIYKCHIRVYYRWWWKQGDKHKSLENIWNSFFSQNIRNFF